MPPSTWIPELPAALTTAVQPCSSGRETIRPRWREAFRTATFFATTKCMVGYTCLSPPIGRASGRLFQNLMRHRAISSVEMGPSPETRAFSSYGFTKAWLTAQATLPSLEGGRGRSVSSIHQLPGVGSPSFVRFCSGEGLRGEREKGGGYSPMTSPSSPQHVGHLHVSFTWS